ncbi:hypothetical protein K2173_002106 [Erythroxylum novogranatense]|uniref:Protein CHUP1, chloroplastic n=1 Tax=Erythroxylum novogranatense TaxID=1862640 RepID=A0AAV8SPJ4_9ROSI|nr:hypothetical protein K2173_002106 [Erythroxylum novogranatense]
MENSTSKTEMVRPLFLKAGISLVLSVAAFVSAKIISRRYIRYKPPTLETKVSATETIDSNEDSNNESIQTSLNCASSPIEDLGEHTITGYQSTVHKESSDVAGDVTNKDDALNLREKLEELQNRELELEKQFLCYYSIKEQESALIELKNKLLMEIAKVDFLDRELSSMEAERQRFENLVMDHLKVLEHLEFAKEENGSLVRKVKRLSRKTKRQLYVIREKNSKIEATEAEMLMCRDVLEARNNEIKNLEDGVRKMEAIVRQLQEESLQHLLTNQSLEESSSTSTIGELMTKEDYNHLKAELEQLQRDRAAKMTELSYLRWTNACLRHELMRNREQKQQIEEHINHLELELEQSREIEDCERRLSSSVSDQSQIVPCSGVATNESHSRRKKLLQKLKKWVDGSDIVKHKLNEKAKHENFCFGTLSVSEEQLTHGGRSCSSA